MTKTITIASGKGGVGKSCLAVNLALAYRKLGQRVALLDTDFGLANAHILMGCNARHTVRDVLDGDKALADVIDVTPDGVKLIAGGSGTVDLLDLDDRARFSLIRSMDALADDTDILLIDAPAGASHSALNFVAAADQVIVTIVGEPTSFMDAYSMIKAAHVEYGLTRFAIVVNMARNAAEAREQFRKFQGIVMKFLPVELTFAGHIPFSAALRRSVVARRPLLSGRSGMDTPEALAIQNIAGTMMKAPRNMYHGIRFFQDQTDPQSEVKGG
jgi:flagellar biosynthesis protein FlhG